MPLVSAVMLCAVPLHGFLPGELVALSFGFALKHFRFYYRVSLQHWDIVTLCKKNIVCLGFAFQKGMDQDVHWEASSRLGCINKQRCLLWREQEKCTFLVSERRVHQCLRCSTHYFQFRIASHGFNVQTGTWRSWHQDDCVVIITWIEMFCL